MAEITVASVQQLLGVDLGPHDSLTLTGDQWSLNAIIHGILTLPEGQNIPSAAHLLRLSEAGRKAIPFDWLTIRAGTDEEVHALTAQAFLSEGGDQPRSVFLPVVLEVLAYVQQPWLLDDSAVEIIHAYQECAWSLMSASKYLIFAASWLVRRACVLYVRAGWEMGAVNVLNSMRTPIENEILQGNKDLSLYGADTHVCLALHETLWSSLEARQPLTARQRTAALAQPADGSQGLTVEQTLASVQTAIDRWEREANAQGWPDRQEEHCHQARLMERHFQLLYQLAHSQARGEWPPFPYAMFEQLGQEFENAGLSPAEVWRAALDHIASCCRGKSERVRHFHAAITRLSLRLEAALPQMPPDRGLFYDSAARLVESFLLLGNVSRAMAWIAEAVNRLIQVVPDIADKYTLSSFLRDSEDWVGYAYLASAGEAPGPERFFDRVYRMFHNRHWFGERVPLGMFVLQVCASRPCVVLSAASPDTTVETDVVGAQGCFATLASMFEAAGRNVTRFGNTKQLPESRTWTDLTAQLIGQFGLNRLYAQLGGKKVDRKCILVRAEGNGLHVPWCGIVAQSHFDPEAVLIADLGVRPNASLPLPTQDASAVVLDCFAHMDPLSAYVARFAAKLNAAHIRCPDPAAFRREILARPYRLIITAGHGMQDAVIGTLSLAIGDQQFEADAVWQDIRLHCGSVVVPITCFGGGGESAATGEFGSISSLALRAGARVVVASRWPAWILPSTVGTYETLFADLYKSSLEADVWHVGRDAMRFQRSMSAQGLWNSVGWGVYVAGTTSIYPSDP